MYPEEKLTLQKIKAIKYIDAASKFPSVKISCDTGLAGSILTAQSCNDFALNDDAFHGAMCRRSNRQPHVCGVIRDRISVVPRSRFPTAADGLHHRFHEAVM